MFAFSVWGTGGDHSPRQEGWALEQGGGHCRDAVDLGRRLGVITAKAFVDLLCSRYCSKCLSYVGVFVV